MTVDELVRDPDLVHELMVNLLEWFNEVYAITSLATSRHLHIQVD